MPYLNETDWFLGYTNGAIFYPFVSFLTMKPAALLFSVITAFFMASAGYAFQPAVQPFSWPELEKQYLVRHYTVEDGLPVNTVSQMLHASDGFIYLLTLDGLVRFDGVRFRVFDSANTPGFKSNRFLNMVEGKDGEIWLNDDLNNFYLFRKGEAFRIQDIEIFRDYKVNKFAVTFEGKIWISTNKGMLYQESGLDFRHPSKDNRLIAAEDLVITQTGSVLVISDLGLNLVTKKESRVVIPADKLKIPLTRIFDVQSAGGSSIWILSDIATAVHVSNTFEQVMYTYSHPGASNHFTVLNHADSSILIKTGTGYVRPALSDNSLEPVVLNGSEKLFTYTNQEKTPVSVLQKVQGKVFVNGMEAFSTSARIYSSLIDREGSIWVSTHGSGIYQMKRKKFITLGEQLRDSLVNIYGMHYYGDDIWGASFIGKVFHITDHQIKSYSASTENTQNKFFTAVTKTRAGDVYLGGFNIWKLNHDSWETLNLLTPGLGSVAAFFEDSNNRFWISTEQSINKLINGKLVPFYDENGTTLTQVRSIQELTDGTLLFATLGKGIAFLGRENKFQFITEHEGLSSNLVRDVYVSSTDTLWVVTENNGLTRLILNPGNGNTVLKAEHITTRDGLSDNSLHRMLEDEFGFFWINSNNKIMRVARQELDDYLDSKTPRLNIESFGTEDGLVNNEGNGGRQNSGVLTFDGKLLFPNQAGLVYTRPEWHVQESGYALIPPKIESVSFENSMFSLAGNAAYALPVSVREFQIKFTLPTFENPDKLTLEYKLEGVNSTWQQAGPERLATFTNLTAGEYPFLMRGKLPGNKEYSEASFLLTIPPLFYETTWFILLIISVLLGLLFLSFQTVISRSRKKEEQLNNLVAQRTFELEEALDEVQKLDEAKSTFFTNFTHELRTPLSLILNPLEDIIERNHHTENTVMNHHLNLMQRNALRLKDLVNHLLDVSKLSAGEFILTVEQTALPGLTKLIISQFEYAINEKGLEVEMHEPDHFPAIFTDTKGWEHICINLLSNAIKYTPPKGTITISFTEKEECIRVEFKDTGTGIPSKEQSRIFDPYYQVGTEVDKAGGTGIGLALVRGLVERMGGTITVESAPGTGSTFIIELRKGSAHFSPKDIIKNGTIPRSEVVLMPEISDQDEKISESPDPSTAKILLVEDNDDFRNYYHSLLSGPYQVQVAANGVQGLEMLEHYQPDIIISDIMMPRMDGYEMMRAIREMEQYRSIPFIFLSARDSDVDIETGLNSGADIYLTKPVKNRLLLTQIKALLRREQYIREAPLSEPSKGVVTLKVEEIIQRHLGNPELSIEMIAGAMLMSRTTLFRKWKKENEVSLVEAVTNKRLEEALRLIQKDELSISEAAFAVGYKHLSHFSRAFKKAYKTPPSEYLKT